jgi:hypothetical protein
VADSGVVLGPTTLVIQMVEISPSEYGDKFGESLRYLKLSVPVRPMFCGTANYLQQPGIDLFADSGTSFTLPDGSPMFSCPRAGLGRVD